MSRKRQPIDDMIDAHVWMRRQEARRNRPLTLDGVPDEAACRRSSTEELPGAAYGFTVFPNREFLSDCGEYATRPTFIADETKLNQYPVVLGQRLVAASRARGPFQSDRH
jgi:hypothetical protein